MRTFSIVVPVYQAEGLIPAFGEAMQRIERELLARSMRLQLIFVDDGCTDGSLEQLRAFAATRPETIVVKLTRNFGAIGASNVGLRYVTGDCFTIMAVDLQDPPELLLEMVDRWRQGAKYVLAERIDRDDPFLTRFLAAVFYALVRVFIARDFPRRGVDLLFWDRSLLPYLRDCGKHVNRAVFAHWLGFKPEILRYHRPRRPAGKSGWSFLKRLNLFIDTFVGFSAVPLRLSSLLGVVVSCFSFLYGCVVFVGALMGRVKVSGFSTIVVLLSFLLGLVMLMLGVLGEYLWRIFDRLNGRPEAVVDEVYDQLADQKSTGTS